MDDKVRKEVVFSDADQELFEYVKTLDRGFSPLVKRLLRDHLAEKKYGIDYSRIREIVEDVFDEKGVVINQADSYETTAPVEVASIFGGTEL